LTNVANRRSSIGLLRQSDTSSSGGVSAVTNIATVDKTITGALGLTLGFAFGLQYDSNSPGVCYIAVEGESEAISQIVDLLRVGYLPSSWSQILTAVEDSVDLLASVFAECQIEKLLTTINSLFSMQGTSQFTSRIGGAMIN
jgi:hypothetical protein